MESHKSGHIKRVLTLNQKNSSIVMGSYASLLDFGEVAILPVLPGAILLQITNTGSALRCSSPSSISSSQLLWMHLWRWRKVVVSFAAPRASLKICGLWLELCTSKGSTSYLHQNAWWNSYPKVWKVLKPFQRDLRLMENFLFFQPKQFAQNLG